MNSDRIKHEVHMVLKRAPLYSVCLNSLSGSVLIFSIKRKFKMAKGIHTGGGLSFGIQVNNNKIIFVYQGMEYSLLLENLTKVRSKWWRQTFDAKEESMTLQHSVENQSPARLNLFEKMIQYFNKFNCVKGPGFAAALEILVVNCNK